MAVTAIIQARMTSSRLPGKVLADLCGQPMLAHMIGRLRRARRVAAIWVATTVNATDDPVAKLCDEMKVNAFRGDETDVLARYAGAAEAAGADTIMRLTADCPMIDPAVLDEAADEFESGAFDYFSNTLIRTFPDGLDFEIFSRAALARTEREARLPFHREHVTPYMRTGIDAGVPTGEFRVGHMRAAADFGHLRWTVDTPADLDLVRALAADLPRDYGWLDVVALLTRRPRLLCGGPTGAPAVWLRPATAEDGDLLFDWLNRVDSHANSLVTRASVPRDAHDTWLAARLASADAGIWIAHAGSEDPIGQVRLERRGDALDVSIYVEASARGRGAATAMLAAARAEAGRRWPRLPLRARIKVDNWPSRRLFVKAGYGRMVTQTDHILLYRDPALPEDAA